MKNLVDILNERRADNNFNQGRNNIIIGTSGSMNSGDVMSKIDDIIDVLDKVYLYAHDTTTDKVVAINKVNDITKFSGPHPKSYDSIIDFYKDNIGSLNIYIQN